MPAANSRAQRGLRKASVVNVQNKQGHYQCTQKQLRYI